MSANDSGSSTVHGLCLNLERKQKRYVSYFQLSNHGANQNWDYICLLFSSEGCMRPLFVLWHPSQGLALFWTSSMFFTLFLAWNDFHNRDEVMKMYLDILTKMKYNRSVFHCEQNDCLESVVVTIYLKGKKNTTNLQILWTDGCD